MKTNTKDLTSGNIYKSLIRFSIPFIIANLIQALYGTTDLLVIGLFTDTAGLSGVSIATQVMQIVNGLIVGITMGGTILIGQYIGSKNMKDTKETIGTLFIIGGVISIIIPTAMFIFKDKLLILLNTPPSAYKDALNYILIASVGTIFIFGYNAISAILRGLGDSKSPVYFISIACVINILLDFILVGYFKFRAGGAALATVISQGVSMIIGLIHITKKKNIFEFNKKSFKIYPDKIKKLIQIGAPLSLQEVLLWGSFLFIVAIANQIGVSESAAVGIVAKFETFSMLPPMAFSYALAAIAAQNIGAKKPERAMKALKASILLSFLSCSIFLLWSQLHPQSIMGIFKADIGVTMAGAEYLKLYSLDFLLVPFKFNLNGFLNGAGRTTFTMINGSVNSLFIRIPMAYIFGVVLKGGLLGLGLSVPVASILSIVVSIIYIGRGKWKEGII